MTIEAIIHGGSRYGRGVGVHEVDRHGADPTGTSREVVGARVEAADGSTIAAVDRSSVRTSARLRAEHGVTIRHRPSRLAENHDRTHVPRSPGWHAAGWGSAGLLGGIVPAGAEGLLAGTTRLAGAHPWIGPAVGVAVGAGIALGAAMAGWAHASAANEAKAPTRLIVGTHHLAVDPDRAAEQFERWPAIEDALRAAVGVDRGRTPLAIAEAIVAAADVNGDGVLDYAGSSPEVMAGRYDITALLQEADGPRRSGRVTAGQLATVIERFDTEAEWHAPVAVRDDLQLSPHVTGLLNDREVRAFAARWLPLPVGAGSGAEAAER